MASFTDAISTFNPYVQQLPIEAMAQVGMYKQQQYDQGVQKVQSYMDRMAGLEVTDKHKPYLQSKLNELSGNLRVFAGADFSDQQLVSSVGGMAAQIGNDPIIQSGVYSAQRIKKGYSDIERDKKEGKLTPDNELYFTKQLQNWNDNPDLKHKFNGEYISHFNVDEFITKGFNSIKPDGFTIDQVYETDNFGRIKRDSNGKPIYSKTMTKLELEGVYPERVRETLEQLLSDPRVSQQLNITGDYVYNSADPQMLLSSINSEKQNSIANLLAEADNLQLRKTAGQNVDFRIDQLSNKMSSIDDYYNELAGVALTDPSRVKGVLYADKVKNNYTSTYSNFKIKETTEVNPGWQANFDLQKEANAQSRWAQDYKLKFKIHQDEMLEKEKDRQSRKEIALLGKSPKGIDTDGDGIIDSFGEGAVGRKLRQDREVSDLDYILSSEKNYTSAADKFISSSDDFLFSTMFNNDESNRAVEKLRSTGMSLEEARTQAINNRAKMQGLSPEEYRTKIAQSSINVYNRMDPNKREQNHGLKDSYDTFRKSYREFLNAKVIKDEQSKLIKSVLTSDEFKSLETNKFKTIYGTYEGNKITVTPEDQYNLTLYLNAHTDILPGGGAPSKEAREMAKQAKQKLEESGKGYLIDAAINQNLGLSANGVTALWRTTGLLATAITAGASKVFTGDTGLPKVDLKHLTNAVTGLNNKALSKAREKQSKVIKTFENVYPSLESTLFVGDETANDTMFQDLKSIVGKAIKSGAQLSEGAQEFAKKVLSVEDYKKLPGTKISYTRGQGNIPGIEIEMIDEDGKVGGYTLTLDEATTFGIDPSAIYESTETKALGDLINYRGGKTSAGNVLSKDVYYNGDVQYEKDDFPGIANMKMEELGADVKGNIYRSGGKYYGVLYVKRPGQEVIIRDVKAESSLQDLIPKFKNAVQPMLINTIR